MDKCNQPPLSPFIATPFIQFCQKLFFCSAVRILFLKPHSSYLQFFDRKDSPLYCNLSKIGISYYLFMISFLPIANRQIVAIYNRAIYLSAIRYSRNYLLSTITLLLSPLPTFFYLSQINKAIYNRSGVEGSTIGVVCSRFKQKGKERRKKQESYRIAPYGAKKSLCIVSYRIQAKLSTIRAELSTKGLYTVPYRRQANLRQKQSYLRQGKAEIQIKSTPLFRRQYSLFRKTCPLFALQLYCFPPSYRRYIEFVEQKKDIKREQ